MEFQRELMKSSIHLPIIFISGHGDIPMSVRAMKSGAVEFLTKPLKEQELLDAIQVGLERDRVRRQETEVVAELQRRFDSLRRANGRSWRSSSPAAGTSRSRLKLN